MKRYHFKTDEQSDVEGVRLADLAAVKCEAGKVPSCARRQTKFGRDANGL